MSFTPIFVLRFIGASCNLTEIVTICCTCFRGFRHFFFFAVSVCMQSNNNNNKAPNFHWNDWNGLVFNEKCLVLAVVLHRTIYSNDRTADMACFESGAKIFFNFYFLSSSTPFRKPISFHFVMRSPCTWISILALGCATMTVTWALATSAKRCQKYAIAVNKYSF